jgi:hypothetical protein
MYRLALALILTTPAFALADTCSVSGTAYDAHGRPAQGVVRLIDLQTQQSAFSATGANAAFSFNAALPGDGPYRLDLISEPNRVTGSRIPTRSIVGMSDTFSCRGALAHQDVRAQVE